MFSRTAKWMVIPAILIFMLALALPALAASVDPVFVAGNPSCTDLGYDYGFKPSDANGAEDVPGTYSDPNYAFIEVMWASTQSGIISEWSSTWPVDAVIVKGGPNANVYAYDPAVTGDTNLSTPINPNNGQPYGISHVEFCFNYNVEVTKTAETEFTREWDWTVAKTGDDGSSAEEPLLLGGSYTVEYTVTATAESYADSDYIVKGDITISNPWNADASLVSVVDEYAAGLFADVDCGVATIVPALGSIVCSYESAPDDVMPEGPNVATATVNFTGEDRTSSGSAKYSFEFPTTVLDDCATVTDSYAGELGEVCVGESPKDFTYSRTFYPEDLEQCDVVYEFENIATLTESDTEEFSEASHSVWATKPCGGGCTLTQGYWKTHSEFGPAPYDDTWAQLANGASTPFFLSGQTYYQVLWTPPAGNPYYSLAHQWIAAYLNVLNGASVPADVQSAWNAAKVLFETYTPAQVAASRTLQRNFRQYIGILDQYNNGYVGPGHCSEDTNSVSLPSTSVIERMLPQPVLLPGNQG